MKIIKKVFLSSLIALMLFSLSFDYFNAQTIDNEDAYIEKAEEQKIETKKIENVKKVSEDKDENKEQEAYEKIGRANAPPKTYNNSENIVNAYTLDEYVSTVDNSDRSMKYQLVSPKVLNEILKAGDVFKVIKIGTYAGNISEFGNYGQYGPLEVYKINSKIVFCVQFGIDPTNYATQTNQKSNKYNSFSSGTKNNINIIASYASKRYEETGNKNYLYAGQILIWDYISPTNWNTSTKSTIQSQINELKTLRRNHYLKPSFDKKTYTLKYNTSTKRYEAILKDTNNVGKRKYTSFVGTYGDYKVEINGYNSIKVSTTKVSTQSKKISASYYAYKNTNNQFFDAAQDMVYVSAPAINMSFNVKVEPYFSEIIVNKTANKLKMNDNKNYPQSGVTFNLEDINGRVIYSLKTNSKGIINFKKVAPGTYYIVEKNVPEGYMKAQKKKVVVKSGQTLTTNINNKVIKGSVYLKKVGESLDSTSKEINTLTGVKFKLLQDTDFDGVYENSVGTYTTDENGEIRVYNLKYGNYEMIEQEAKEGYVLDNQPYKFEIRKNNENIKINGSGVIQNKVIKGEAKLLKVGETLLNEDNELVNLAEVKFKLKQDVDYDGTYETEVGVYQTDEKGLIKIPDLDFGKYELYEIEAISGYNINDAKLLFEITKDNEVVQINSDKPFINDVIDSDVNVFKVDEDKNEPLSGATFKVYRAVLKEDVSTSTSGYKKDINNYDINEEAEVIAYDKENNELTEVTTDKAGKLSINDLKYGTYVLIETKAPIGYVLDSKPILFSVTTEGEIINLSVVNSKIKNEIVIDKVDMTNDEELEGAKLCLSDSSDKMIECFTSTKESHKITVDYGYGYKICEEIAPIGYVKLNQCTTFDVTENGIVQHFKIKNEIIKSGSVTLVKQDEDTNQKLSGATFELLKKNNRGKYETYLYEGKDKFTTNTSGEINLENVEYGSYAFREIAAPEGYVLERALITFDVTKNGEDINLEFSNKEKPEILVTGINYSIKILIVLIGIVIALYTFRKMISKKG